MIFKSIKKIFAGVYSPQFVTYFSLMVTITQLNVSNLNKRKVNVFLDYFLE